MSRQAWLTPNDAPSPAVCRTVFIPGGLEYEAAFRGAYLLLCDAFNWEETGAQTPESCADAFQAALFQTLDSWKECPVSGLIVGEIRVFPAVPLPSGWLPCDGQLLNPADKPDLFDYLGTTYGGDGTNTFGIPDLRGRVLVGAGAGTGLTPRNVADTGGEETHVLTVSEIPAHSHQIANYSQSATFQSGTDRTALRNTPGTNTNTSSLGGGEAHENMPPFLSLVYAIYSGG